MLSLESYIRQGSGVGKLPAASLQPDDSVWGDNRSQTVKTRRAWQTLCRALVWPCSCRCSYRHFSCVIAADRAVCCCSGRWRTLAGPLWVISVANCIRPACHWYRGHLSSGAWESQEERIVLLLLLLWCTELSGGTCGSVHQPCVCWGDVLGF